MKKQTKIKQTSDPINPDHYKINGHECIDATRDMGFQLGNAFKYVWRSDLKGNKKQDLQKAEWYLKDFITTQKLKKQNIFEKLIDFITRDRNNVFYLLIHAEQQSMKTLGIDINQNKAISLSMISFANNKCRSSSLKFAALALSSIRLEIKLMDEA